MSAVVPLEGLRLMLLATLARPLRLALFANDHDPVKTDTLIAYDLVPGTQHVVDPAAWEVEATDSGWLAKQPPHFWRFDLPIGTCWGYVLFDETGRLVQAERFGDGPYLVERIGDDIRVAVELEFFREDRGDGTA